MGRIIWCMTTSPVAEANANSPSLIALATSARATVPDPYQLASLRRGPPPYFNNVRDKLPLWAANTA